MQSQGIVMQKLASRENQHGNINTKTINNTYLLYCDASDSVLDEDILDQDLFKISNCTQISIGWCKRLDKQNIVKILQSIKTCNKLILQNCTYFDSECLQLLINNYGTTLQKFTIGVDFFAFIQNFIEDLNFLGEQIIRPKSLSLEDNALLSNMCPKLKNIWISEYQKEQAAQILHNMQHLQQIVIGDFLENMNKINSKIFDELEQITRLKSLALLRCTGLTRIKTVIENNHQLQSLIFYKCYGMNEKILQAITQSCPNLIKLCIVYGNQTEGRNLWNLTKLKVLILNNCARIDQKLAITGFKKLTNLQFLDLCSNKKWVDDRILYSISSLKKLRYLNIERGAFSEYGFKDLCELKSLKTLICGWSDIGGHEINKLTHQLNNITKLSINALDGAYGSGVSTGYVSKMEMENILTNINVTHLSVAYCRQLQKLCLKHIPFLKTLHLGYSQLSPKQASVLRSRGVIFYGQLQLQQESIDKIEYSDQ